MPTASSPPLGLNATALGAPPTGYGEPGTCVSAPVVWSTENTDTVLSPSLATASSPPPGLKATESGAAPEANGEPDTCTNPNAEGANAQTVANTIASTTTEVRPAPSTFLASVLITRPPVV